MFGSTGLSEALLNGLVVKTHVLSFFLASSEASELLKVARAASAPAMGDRSGLVFLEVVFLGGDPAGVAAVWLIRTPFLYVLMLFGTNFLLELPHKLVKRLMPAIE